MAVNPPVSLREQLADPGGLLRAVRRVLPDDSTQLLVVIDQLEELFTLESSTDERERFLSELASAITAPGSPLRVIATLRADHYDGPLSNAAFAHLVSEGTVAVEPFTPAELEEAIVRPAESVGVQVEPALVAELVAAAGLRPASLPLLQFALTETFRRRPEAQLSLITYQELGGLTGALAVRADELIGAGDSVDRTEARRIFGRLVVIEPSGLPSRRRARLSELGTADRTASLIERLVAARLLTVDRDDTSREPTVEVAHEALLRDWPTLLNWINEDREQLRVVHAVNERARVWVEAERDPSELARGARLFSASELLGCRSDLLTADEVAWVEASQEQEDAAVAAREAQIEHEQHQNRRLRGLLAGAGVLLAVSLVAAGVAVWQRSESVDREAEARSAEDAARTAEQEAASAQSSAEESLRLAEGAERMADAARGDAEIERLVALASAEIESTPDRAALIALEANRRRDDAVTRSALQRTIATEPRLSRVISPGSPDADLWLATDGSTIVSASPDGLEWIDPTTGEPDGTAFAVEGLGGGSGQVLISETGLVAVTTERDEESMTTLLRRDGDSVQELGVRDAWAFSIGGDMVALSGDDAVVFVDPVAGVEVIWPVPSDWGIWTVVASGGARAVIAWRSSDPDGGPEIFGLDVVDLLSGEVVDSLARDRELTAMALSADGVLAAGYPNGDLVVRNVEDLEGSAIRRVAHGREVQAIGIGADGRISTGGADRSVHFWTADAERSGDGAGVRGANAQVAVDSGGRTLVWHDSTNVYIYGSSDRRIVDHRVDDPRPDWEEGPRVEQAPNEISRLVDGGRSLVLESFEGVERQTLDLAAAHDGVPVVDWSFSGDGQRVLSLDEGVVEGSGDGRWVVTSIDGTTISSWPDERVHAAIRDVGARSPFNWWMDETGERALFHGAGDAEGGFVFAIDTSTGALVDGPVSVPVPSSFGLRGEFLADGGIVLGGHGGELVVLDGDLTERMTIDGGAGLTPLDHDPSTGLVLLGGADGATVVLDSATGALRSLVGGVGNIALGAFSPDSSTVAVVSPDAGLILFDVGTGEILGVPMVPGGGAFGGGPGIHWESDGTGFWLHPGGGPVRFVTDPSRWRDIACEMAGRELTAEEWRTLISETEPQVASCTDTV